MKVFDIGEKCSKCGGFALKIEYQGEAHIRSMYRLTGVAVEDGRTEQLQLTCTVCSYRFYRAPLDSIKVI